MKQRIFCRNLSPWSLRALILMGALATVACGGDVVKITPTQPEWPFDDWSTSGLGARILDISGELVARQGSCFEATILYDGRELDRARAVCSADEGCERLSLDAQVRTEEGHHTISFQVLSQSAEAIDYAVEGEVQVARVGLDPDPWHGFPWLLTIPLNRASSTLRAGESVTFDIDLRD